MPTTPFEFESADFMDKLEQLLSQKSFDQLTGAEQNWVLQHMSQTDYDAQHHLLVRGKIMFREQVPKQALPPALKQNLMKAVKKKPQASGVIHNLFHISTNIFSFLQKILTHRTPSWQPALLIMGILLAWNFIAKNEINSTQNYPPLIHTKTPISTEIVYLCTTDTFIVEKIVDKVHLVEVERLVYVDKYVDKHRFIHNNQAVNGEKIEGEQGIIQNLAVETSLLNKKNINDVDNYALSTLIDQQSDQNWIVNGGKPSPNRLQSPNLAGDKVNISSRNLQQDRIFSQFFTKVR